MDDPGLHIANKSPLSYVLMVYENTVFRTVINSSDNVHLAST